MILHGFSSSQLSQLKRVAEATGGGDVPKLDAGAKAEPPSAPDLSAESKDPKVIAMRKALVSVTHMAENWTKPSIESLRVGAAIVSSDEARETYQALRNLLTPEAVGGAAGAKSVER